mgnify:FL=1|jgi:hypothetical protein
MTTVELINKRIIIVAEFIQDKMARSQKIIRESFLLVGFLLIILQIQICLLFYAISKLN